MSANDDDFRRAVVGEKIPIGQPYCFDMYWYTGPITIDERVVDELERRGWRCEGRKPRQGICARRQAKYDAIRADIENEEKSNADR